MYTYLLEIKTEDEMVKECMVRWAQNLGYSIDLEDWERVWKINIKITRSVRFKENLYKMFYR